jgi:hypothetical protein
MREAVRAALAASVDSPRGRLARLVSRVVGRRVYAWEVWRAEGRADGARWGVYIRLPGPGRTLRVYSPDPPGKCLRNGVRAEWCDDFTIYLYAC